jgi:hypothetical protein
VAWWTEESITDTEAIQFINENISSMPTEKLIYDWIFPDWRREFMPTSRAPGTRYDEAWEFLRTEQKLAVAA